MGFKINGTQLEKYLRHNPDLILTGYRIPLMSQNHSDEALFQIIEQLKIEKKEYEKIGTFIYSVQRKKSEKVLDYIDQHGLYFIIDETKRT